MLTKESYIKLFGQQMVFQLLLFHLKILETEGIECDDTNYKCQLFSILGDNLGAHMVGGFTESFSAEYFCRYCLIRKAEFNCVPHEIGEERTKQKYDAAVYDAEHLPASMVQGIKFNSVFYDLQSFHVCKPGLPPCLGHDLMEGVVAVDIALFVHYFVNENWFTYELLNKRITCFPYAGYDALSKPPIIPMNATKLIGQATENWCILRLFPLIVFDLVQNKEDKVWLLLLQLREIVNLVTAPRLSKSQVGYLNIIIKDYAYHRKLFFPQKN